MLETFLERRLQTAVRVQNVLAHPNQLAEVLRRVAEPALFISPNHRPYDLSKSGSLTKIKHMGRYYGVVCEHQVTPTEFGHDQLVLWKGEAGKFLTSHRAVFEAVASESKSLDLILYEFTDVVDAGNISKHGWYKIDNELGPTPATDIAFTIGYPGYRNEIDYDSGHYGMSPNVVCGVPTMPTLNDRLCFTALSRTNFEPKGMSGGPVFGIKWIGLEPQVFLAGILTNASRTTFNFQPLSRLRQLIDHAERD